MYSRRDFGKIALAAAPLSQLFGKVDSKVNGVQLGAQSYSFRVRPLDEALKAMPQSESAKWNYGRDTSSLPKVPLPRI